MRNKITVSTVRNAFSKDIYKNISFENVVEIIGSSSLESQLIAIRSGKGEKTNLPAFMPHGVFEGGRSDSNLKEYSQLIHLDFDKIPVNSVGPLRAKIESHWETFCCFLSPSLRGLKVFVKVDSPVSFHKGAYNQISDFYFALTGYMADPVCKSISRLCFFSHDPNIFYNSRAEPFSIYNSSQSGPVNKHTISEKAELLIELTKKVKGDFAGGYFQGNRNGFIYTLANNCNRYGLTMTDAESVCHMVWENDKSEFPISELIRTIRSAYKNAREHGMFDFKK